MPDRRRALRRLGLTCAGLAVVASAGFLLAACGGGDGSAVTTRTDVTATRPPVTATRPAVTQTRTTEPTPIAPPPATTSQQPPPPPPHASTSTSATSTSTSTATSTSTSATSASAATSAATPAGCGTSASATTSAANNGRGCRAVVYEQHALGLDRPRSRPGSGIDSGAPPLETSTGPRCFMVRPAGRSLPPLSRRARRRPRRWLRSDGPDSGARRRSAIARDARSRRSVDAGRGPTARRPRRARADARGRPNPPTQLAAPECGPAVVLDGSHSPARRGAPARAAASERRPASSLTRSRAALVVLSRLTAWQISFSWLLRRW